MSLEGIKSMSVFTAYITQMYSCQYIEGNEKMTIFFAHIHSNLLCMPLSFRGIKKSRSKRPLSEIDHRKIYRLFDPKNEDSLLEVIILLEKRKSALWQGSRISYSVCDRFVHPTLEVHWYSGGNLYPAISISKFSRPFYRFQKNLQFNA